MTISLNQPKIIPKGELFFLAVCVFCGKVCTSSNKWRRLPKRLLERPSIVKSHGLCPDCLKSQYPESCEN